MYKAGKKRPLRECLGENSNELRHKRRRFDNIVLLGETGGARDNGDFTDRRYYADFETVNNTAGSSRRILRAGGKRKKPTDADDNRLTILDKQAEKLSDENDVINELTKEFKKARLRPVFFSISSFIEQTVDEVGFTMGDEPEIEVTVRLALPMRKESVLPEEKQDTIDVTSDPISDQESTLIDDFANPCRSIKFHEEIIKKTSSFKIFSSLADSVENGREGI